MTRRNKYDLTILNKFDGLLNIFIPIAIIGTLMIMVLFYLNTKDLILLAFFQSTIIILILLFIFKKKASTLVKVYCMIGLAIIGATLIIIRTGFDAAGLVIYLMGAIIVFGLLSKKTSISYMFISSFVLLCVAVITSNEHDTPFTTDFSNPLTEHFVLWSIIIVLYIVFSFLLFFIIHSIKDDLIKSLYDAEHKRKQIEKMAFYDSSSELPNLNYLERRYEQLISKSGFLAILNIQGFGLIKSVYGNDVVNNVVRKTAFYLQKIASETDLIGRIGDNEFFWCIKTEDEEEAIRSIHNFITFTHNGQDTFDIDFNVIYKVGIVHTDNSQKDINDWIRKAYSALDKTTLTSKKIISWYDEDTEKALKAEEILSEKLAEAIEKKEFQMYYQEKTDCRNGHVVGVEALVRWHSPILGMISPVEFVPLIDKLQYSVTFGEEIMRLVSEDYPVLMSRYEAPFTISINVSPHHLAYEDFLEFVKDNIIEKQIDPHRIIFEITEDNLIKDLDGIDSILSTLHLMGFKLSIDDFGTGYSSLSYLSKLKVDELKIDQFFIMNMPNDERTQKLVKAIIGLKKIYDFEIIAEGVETEAIAEALRMMECYIHQGYLYSKPSPINIDK